MPRSHLLFSASTTFAAALLLSGPHAVVGKPVGTIGYSHYAVSGDTARQLLMQMQLHGPTVDGSEAYASTETTMQQTGDVVQSSKGCTLRNYQIRIDFTIRLPTVQSTNGMSGKVRSAWKTFYAFVKKHEETHKAIWMSCARELETKVKALRVKDCDAMQTKINALFADMNAQCNRRHDAFDRAERARLKAQPLVKLATSGH